MADQCNCLVGQLIELNLSGGLYAAQSARNKLQLLSTDVKHDILYLLCLVKLLSFAVM